VTSEYYDGGMVNRFSAHNGLEPVSTITLILQRERISVDVEDGMTANELQEQIVAECSRRDMRLLFSDRLLIKGKVERLFPEGMGPDDIPDGHDPPPQERIPVVV
jgi:hypothetical protein